MKAYLLICLIVVLEVGRIDCRSLPKTQRLRSRKSQGKCRIATKLNPKFCDEALSGKIFDGHEMQNQRNRFKVIISFTDFTYNKNDFPRLKLKKQHL